MHSRASLSLLPLVAAAMDNANDTGHSESSHASQRGYVLCLTSIPVLLLICFAPSKRHREGNTEENNRNAPVRVEMQEQVAMQEEEAPVIRTISGQKRSRDRDTEDEEDDARVTKRIRVLEAELALATHQGENKELDLGIAKEMRMTEETKTEQVRIVEETKTEHVCIVEETKRVVAVEEEKTKREELLAKVMEAQAHAVHTHMDLIKHLTRRGKFSTYGDLSGAETVATVPLVFERLFELELIPKLPVCYEPTTIPPEIRVKHRTAGKMCHENIQYPPCAEVWDQLPSSDLETCNYIDTHNDKKFYGVKRIPDAAIIIKAFNAPIVIVEHKPNNNTTMVKQFLAVGVSR
jgi:hypothetical protein